MRILVLDDEIDRLRKFKRALIGHLVELTTTVPEVLERLQNETWDYVFLDHDLGGKINVPSGPGTGYEVAEWLAANPDRQPKHIIIHSFCEHGRQNMKNILPNAEVIPGAWLLIEPGEAWTELKFKQIPTVG